MKNYICIGGKKAALTPEQLKLLGIKVKEKSPFERVECHDTFYCIGHCGKVELIHEFNDNINNILYSTANYCTDKSLMEQRALHETLNRLLWRYSMEHKGNEIDWDNTCQSKYSIISLHHKWDVTAEYEFNHFGVPFFYSEEIAESAIKEIIEPFMKEHPEFKW